MKKIIGLTLSVLSLACSSIVNEGSDVAITVTPVKMVHLYSADFPDAGDNLLWQARTNAVTNTVSGSVKDFAVAQHRIDWSDVYVPASNPNKNFVYSLVDAQSISGEDTISLSSLRTSIKTTRDSLNSDGDYSNAEYKPRAIGITKAGRVIDSGSADQKCKRVLLIIYSQWFDDEQSSVVKNWINEQVSLAGDFGLTYSAWFEADESTKSVAKVSIKGSVPPAPILVISPDSVSITNGVSGQFYSLFATTKLGDKSAVIGLGVVEGKNPLSISFNDGEQRYFWSFAQ